MVLLVLAIVLGVIIGVWIDKIGLRNKLYSNRKVIILIYLICFLGVVFLLGGMLLNQHVVKVNGEKMPIDKSVMHKYNLKAKDDAKHGNILGEPVYPELIDKYYFPVLSIIKKEVYSLGDLISYFGILVSFMTIIPAMRAKLIKEGYKFKVNKRKLD